MQTWLTPPQTASGFDCTTSHGPGTSCFLFSSTKLAVEILIFQSPPAWKKVRPSSTHSIPLTSSKKSSNSRHKLRWQHQNFYCWTWNSTHKIPLEENQISTDFSSVRHTRDVEIALVHTDFCSDFGIHFPTWWRAQHQCLNSERQ